MFQISPRSLNSQENNKSLFPLTACQGSLNHLDPNSEVGFKNWQLHTRTAMACFVAPTRGQLHDSTTITTIMTVNMIMFLTQLKPNQIIISLPEIKSKLKAGYNEVSKFQKQNISSR